MKPAARLLTRSAISEPANGADRPRRAGMRGLYCGKGERQAEEIVTRIVGRIAVLLDGAQEIGHRAVKAVVEPGTLQHRTRNAGLGEKRYRLVLQIRSGARQATRGSRDIGRVEGAKPGMRIEDQRSLAAVECDKSL